MYLIHIAIFLVKNIFNFGIGGVNVKKLNYLILALIFMVGMTFEVKALEADAACITASGKQQCKLTEDLVVSQKLLVQGDIELDLNGYTIHTFYYWKRLLKEEALQNISVPEIVPLVQPPSPVLQGESLPLNLCNSHKLHELETPSQNITVSFGDIRIEIGKNAPDDIIANIIKAMRNA